MDGDLKSFDRVADCYDATRSLPRDAQEAVAAGIMRALHAVAAVPRVLEVGIGTGRIAIPLAALGARLFGVDIAPAMLERLRAKRADLSVVLAEATRLPFRGQVFDGALFVHILHLLGGVEEALRAASRVVRPGGILLYGRTDYAESPRRQVIAQARQLVQKLVGVELGTADWHAEADRAFAAHARAVGAHVHESELTRWQERATGREFLAALEGRVYSSTWLIPEAVMPELITRLTPWIEALLGGLDRPVENEASFTLVTARLPA